MFAAFGRVTLSLAVLKLRWITQQRIWTVARVQSRSNSRSMLFAFSNPYIFTTAAVSFVVSCRFLTRFLSSRSAIGAALGSTHRTMILVVGPFLVETQ